MAAGKTSSGEGAVILFSFISTPTNKLKIKSLFSDANSPRCVGFCASVDVFIGDVLGAKNGHFCAHNP